MGWCQWLAMCNHSSELMENYQGELVGGCHSVLFPPSLSFSIGSTLREQILSFNGRPFFLNFEIAPSPAKKEHVPFCKNK